MPTELAHVLLVAERMREADRLEVLASDGLSPKDAILASWRVSDFTRTLLLNGEPAAVFGARLLADGTAQPWALTSDVVDRNRKAFWRASKHVTSALLDRYHTLVQCVDARHARALRWVARLGFEVSLEPHACGPGGALFHQAILRRN